MTVTNNADIHERPEQAGEPGTVWHLYLIECTGGFLYSGITTDVERRFRQHVAGKGARYTRSHPPLRLVASCPVGSKSQALRAELAIKRLPKDRKILAMRGHPGLDKPPNQDT